MLDFEGFRRDASPSGTNKAMLKMLEDAPKTTKGKGQASADGKHGNGPGEYDV